MGCNFSNKTVNSIERRRNDIIDMVDIKGDIQLIKFIKMPNLNSGKFDYKSRADDTTQGPVQSCYSLPSNPHQAIRTAHLGNQFRQMPHDSNASIAVSENHLPTGERLFDHRKFLEEHPAAKLTSVTIYGFNYITAIKTTYRVPELDDPVVITHCGSAYEHAKRKEQHSETLNLEQAEQIETVFC